MNAIITVVGKDMVGVCADKNVNVEEVTQSILRDMFAMVMLVDVTKCACEFTALQKNLEEIGKELGVEIHITRQELFDAMHRI
ncbi:MAG: ACT domain-containing protein [Oscillospiraceae bacterium]